MRSIKLYTRVLTIFMFLLTWNAVQCFKNKYFHEIGERIFHSQNGNHKRSVRSDDDLRNADEYINSDISGIISNPDEVIQTPIKSATVKKWQVGRVSQKQFEIVNMLWRKTNIFIDAESTTEGNSFCKNTTGEIHRTVHPYPKNKSFKDPISRPIFYSSTPSYIEFYYLDEIDDLSTKPEPERKLPRHSFAYFKFLVSRSPFFAFHINNPAYKRTTFPSSSISKTTTTTGIKKNTVQNNSNIHLKGTITINLPTFKHEESPEDINTTKISSTSNKKNFMIKRLPNEVFIEDETSYNYSSQSSIGDETISSPIYDKNVSATVFTIVKNISSDENNTPAYDKIKFFEMYDSNTRMPLVKNETKPIYRNEIDVDDTVLELGISSNQTILEHVDLGMRQHDGQIIRYAKKHIKAGNEIPEFHGKTHSVKENTSVSNLNLSVEWSTLGPKNIENPFDSLSKISRYTFDRILNSNSFSNLSRTAAWSEYPFIAVYVYERYQVHCDAAIISPHWLLASGSCLSRYREDPDQEVRSAFVTYCGERWWSPELITYVKYTIVHPRYSHRDRTRRHLYNIGLIQVVSSMASACSNWEAISIMSHQFVADPDGSLASAVGWGLNRYNTKYSMTDLPRRPLSMYEGPVFTDSCPGNIGYRGAKKLNEEGVKNLYCLTLPPYSNEENDVVHGGLLLVGGKLIALYLQEERRQWGAQSAQYTGIWKLVPWLHDVAREAEEVDYFM